MSPSKGNRTSESKLWILSSSLLSLFGIGFAIAGLLGAGRWAQFATSGCFFAAFAIMFKLGLFRRSR